MQNAFLSLLSDCLVTLFVNEVINTFMIRIEWPTEWNVEFLQALRHKLQSIIREAMEKNRSPLVRGKVKVYEIDPGTVAPILLITQLRELSPSHTSFDAKVKYTGDASVGLSGLEINLDGGATFGSEEFGNVNSHSDFFINLEIKLGSLELDGELSVDLTQVLQESKTASCSESPTLPDAVLRHQRNRAPTAAPNPTRWQPGSSTATTNFSKPSATDAFPLLRDVGTAVLFTAGGRRCMQIPSHVAEGVFAPRPAATSPAVVACAATRTSFYDVAVRKSFVVKPGSKKLKLQLFDDILKNFQVISNFSHVPGANKKIEDTLKNLLRPALENLKSNGMEIIL